MTWKELGRRYPASHHAVRAAVIGERWGHITDPPPVNSTGPAKKKDLPVGEDHHGSQLTETDVCEMRRAYTEGEVTYSDLSERFGVSTSTVGRIIKQESWSHV